MGIYQEFLRQGYFQQAYGFDCVDAGRIYGTLGSDISVFFYRKLKKRDIWPIEDMIAQYSESDLFDVIELLLS